MSVKYQVLSQKTAFICVVKELGDAQKQEFSDKGQVKEIVPQIQSQDYLVVLIDVDALGLEAFELAREIRVSDSEIPIVGVTDVADLHVMYKAIDNGMNVCVQRAELLETLNFYKGKTTQKEVA